MERVISAYRTVHKYRKHIAAGLATALLLKNGRRNLAPEYLVMPYFASLDVFKFPGEYQNWLVRVAKRDCDYDGAIFPFITKSTTQPVSGGYYGFGPLKPICYVGVPKTFYCSNYIEASELKICIAPGVAVGLESKTEERFLESVCLSDAAQKFSIARHLMYFKGNYALVETLLSPLFVLIGYFLTVHGPRLLNLGTHVTLGPVLRAHLVAIGVTYVACTLAWASLRRSIGYTVDRKAAEVSEEYAQGAVEYYKKERELNMATRILLGAKGDRYFTALGNCKDGVFFNKNGPSVSQRELQAKKIYDNFLKISAQVEEEPTSAAL